MAGLDPAIHVFPFFARADFVFFMKNLSRSERAIRQSRGIPLWRILPFVIAAIAVLVMSADQSLFHSCLGRDVNETRDRVATLIRVVIAIACSPYYVREFSQHWLVIATFCAGVGFAIPQIFWFKRHKAYWDIVREKERRTRDQKRAEK